MRLAPIWFLVFALAGEWVTTEPGTRVCRLQQTIVYGMILTPSFCADWQAPFRAPQYGETIPLDQGWWRRAPGGDGYQIMLIRFRHTGATCGIPAEKVK